MPTTTSPAASFIRVEKVQTNTAAALAEYVDFYKALQPTPPVTEEAEQQFLSQLSVKLDRSIVAQFQDLIGGLIQQEARRLAMPGSLDTDAQQVQLFLTEHPLPAGLAAHLPDEYRIYSLLLNVVKQFISREQPHTDSHVFGNSYKKQAKQAFAHCLVSGEKLGADVEWHHVLRDGRPPIPLTKIGHQRVDRSARERILGGDKVYEVLRKVKKGRNVSWKQLRNACEHSIASGKGNTAWRRDAQKALQDASLPHDDQAILDWLNEHGELLLTSH